MLFSTKLPWYYFCVEIKVLGMTWKSTETCFGINEKYWRKNQDQGAHTRSTRVGARLPPGRAPCLVGPLELHRPQLQLYIFTFGEKKIKEKDSSCFTIRSRRQALVSLGRADLESVWAPERGIRRRRHHQPSSITNFMMLTTVRE